MKVQFPRIKVTNTNESSATLNGYFLDKLLLIAQRYWMQNKVGFGRDWLEMQFRAILNRSPSPLKFNSIREIDQAHSD